jgi:hypothetical protein
MPRLRDAVWVLGCGRRTTASEPGIGLDSMHRAIKARRPFSLDDKLLRFVVHPPSSNPELRASMTITRQTCSVNGALKSDLTGMPPGPRQILETLITCSPSYSCESNGACRRLHRPISLSRATSHRA